MMAAQRGNRLRWLLVALTSTLAIGWSTPASSGDPEFKGKIGKTPKDSVPSWPELAKAPKGAPNIVVILLDDIGFADASTFGGFAETPELDRIAKSGLRYNNFNVTAMCSPTRASLLTGHNHHRTGFAAITEYANGYPGYDSYWKKSTASVAEVLRRNGYNTAAIGKWHNTPEWEISQAGPFDRWPTGLGFEYFYGFMGAEDNQWEPNRLYRNTTPIEAPQRPGETYHLTKDLADKSIDWLNEHRSIGAEKPYFLYLATGGVHTPHHAPREWIERYKGRFDKGWDVLRKEIFARQKRLGVVPADAVLTPRPDAIPAWKSLSQDERRLFARQMEVYAAYVAYTDHEVGRVLEAVRDDPISGDNTLVFYIVGDNGAVGNSLPNYGGTATLVEDLKRIDDFGGPAIPFNQYQGGWGWMGNTPFQYWKTVASHLGGLRAPMIVSWPGKVSKVRSLRQQFAHVTDIAPTIYEAVGIAPTAAIDGVTQQPLDGRSLLPTFANADAPSVHTTQYFELAGNRAIYQSGWMASALSASRSPSGKADDWELYNVAKDFSQSQNIAAQYPEKLAELKALFDREAWSNNVYPLGGANVLSDTKPFSTKGKTRFDFFQGEAMIPYAHIPKFNRSHTLEAEILVPEVSVNGMLASFGFSGKGFAWYVRDGQMIYENSVGVHRDVVSSEKSLESGKHVLRYQFICETCEGQGQMKTTISGTARLFIDGKLAAEQQLEKVNLLNSGESFALNIGRVGGSRVGEGYTAPFPFTGKLERFTITLD